MSPLAFMLTLQLSKAEETGSAPASTDVEQNFISIVDGAWYINVHTLLGCPKWLAGKTKKNQ